eukprot:2571294-Rhodomonas_salina.3
MLPASAEKRTGATEKRGSQLGEMSLLALFGRRSFWASRRCCTLFFNGRSVGPYQLLALTIGSYERYNMSYGQRLYGL